MQSAPSIHLFVRCLFLLFWTERPLTFTAWMCMGYDHSLPWIEGQGQNAVGGTSSDGISSVCLLIFLFCFSCLTESVLTTLKGMETDIWQLSPAVWSMHHTGNMVEAASLLLLLLLLSNEGHSLWTLQIETVTNHLSCLSRVIDRLHFISF